MYRASTGKSKKLSLPGVSDISDLFSFDQDCIKSEESTASDLMTVDIPLCNSADLLLFLRRDRVTGAAISLTCTVLYFNKAYHITFPGNDIDLADLYAIIPFQYRKAFLRQKAAGQIFLPAAYRSFILLILFRIIQITDCLRKYPGNSEKMPVPGIPLFRGLPVHGRIHQG